MSLGMSAWVWSYSKATGSDLLVLLALASFASPVGLCWPSLTVLAARARVPPDEAAHALERLIALGEVALCEGVREGGSNVAFLVGRVQA